MILIIEIKLSHVQIVPKQLSEEGVEEAVCYGRTTIYYPIDDNL